MEKIEEFIDRLLDWMEDILFIAGALVMLGLAVWAIKIAFTVHCIAPGYCY